MAKYKVEISGINTSDLERLSNEEMNNLFKALKRGDKFSKDLLVEGNLKLVLSILKKFSNKTENLDDLFQIGCIGLIKAIDNFDLDYGVKFSTYAVPMILGEIKRYIRDNNPLRVSRSLKDIAYRSIKIKDDYFLEEGKEASVDYVSKKLGVSKNELIMAWEALKEPISMYETVYSDGGDTIYLYDQIEDKNIGDFSSQVALNEAFIDLDDREQTILNNRFIIGKTQSEIADDLGISQAQVSRLEKRAVKELKKVLN